jgi:hypothetical protein
LFFKIADITRIACRVVQRQRLQSSAGPLRWADLRAFSDQFTEGQKIDDNCAAGRSLQQTGYVAFPLVIAQG